MMPSQKSSDGMLLDCFLYLQPCKVRSGEVVLLFGHLVDAFCVCL